MSASNQKSYLRDGNNPRAVDGSRDKSRSSRRDDDKSSSKSKHSSSSGRRLSESRSSHGRKSSTASSSERPSFEMDIIGQPARSIVFGQTVETSVMVSLRCPSPEMVASCRNMDTSRLMGVVSLVADTRGGERVAVECGTLTGQKMFDSVHDVPEEVAESLARSQPCRLALGYFTFPQLLIRQPGAYRLRVTLIKQSSAGGSSVIAIDSESIKVERRATGGSGSTGRKHAYWLWPMTERLKYLALCESNSQSHRGKKDNEYKLASLQLEIQPFEESKHKYEALIAGEQPFIVAVIDQQVVGFAYSSDFNERLGYQHTVEDSVYLHPDHLGKGLGRILLQAIIDRLGRLGKKVVVAKMSILPGQDPKDNPSCRLHLALGFRVVGRMLNVGFKLDTLVDVIILQLDLVDVAAEMMTGK
ncbi:L-methionine sulfoximine/L-methionine sulfone acetyltransferase [Pseudocercospora fuligena]|uniref:L-methionine sulfoximine/L-methionine sulfone acetyltransferase n=1 Tax=Pseudocercospora fuligena TaxID=685502 RepID=A0A8H6VLN3_9PEZI|nr:L-methionine sulfoximine/L-methionine sulfone acetyltransferase [Pseudocercospora fuligena]